MGRHLTWFEICRSKDLQGLWVALEHCRYDRNASHPIEADVIDADENLTELCNRIREAERSCCSIVFCDKPSHQIPSLSRVAMPLHASRRFAGPADGASKKH